VFHPKNASATMPATVARSVRFIPEASPRGIDCKRERARAYHDARRNRGTDSK
jgi:hypothetical protein